ncbi:MAG TPA: sulfite exporter TauE/SafE family protein [Gemmatimonadaceae bacterium]|nr:sulfite exporter TauE/SafE family protein [Gemmatimonadaceae bacterium]
MHDATTVYVVVVIFLATLIRSTIGFGEALVGVPLLALRIPVAVAAPLAVAVSVGVAALIVVQDWRQIEVRSAGWLVGASLLGIPFGLLLLTTASDTVVKLILGVVIAGFAIYSLVVRTQLHLHEDHRAWLLGAGFCSGVLGGAYGMNGPPLAIYGALRRWSPQQFRATLQGYFLAASIAGLIGYAVVGLWRPEVTRYFVLCVPAVCVGVVIGRWLNRRLSGAGFFRVVYVGLIATGIALVAQAFVGA